MRWWPVVGGSSLLLGTSLVLAQSDVVDADDARSAFGAATLSETARVTLYAGHAEWRSLVEARNDGAERASAELWFQQNGAVGAGLALLEADGRRIEGRLSWALGAAQTFARLAGPGHSSRDPGWMRQMSPGTLAISVLPVLSGQSRTFEYRVSFPTRYEDGRHRLFVPYVFEGKLTVEAGEPGARVFLDGAPLASGSVVSIEEPGELALEPRAPPPILAELAVVPLLGRRFVRFEARLAADLQPIPRDAALVIAIDCSRSMGSHGIRAARAAARAYLTHFAAGRVRVLELAHRVTWQQPDFVSPAVASRGLERDVPLQNGSDVIEALRVAAAALRDVGGEKRILLLSDARVSRAITPALLDQVMRSSGALVHTAVVAPSRTLSVVRADGHVWAPATEATGGVLWRLLVPETSLDGPMLRALVEPWAHPIELEQVAWASPNVGLPAPPRRLARGAGLVHEGFSFAWPREAKLTGLLWSKRVELRVRPDPAVSGRWSRLLLGSPLAAELTPAEDAMLADKTGSVSATRSLLAIEPGATPVGGASGVTVLESSVAGDPNAPWQELFAREPPDDDCAECWQRHVTEAVAGGLEVSIPDDRQARDEHARACKRDLTRRARAQAARCGARGGHAEIELTLDEIVSVTIDTALAGARTCLESAVWAIGLGASCDAAYQAFRIDLDPPA